MSVYEMKIVNNYLIDFYNNMHKYKNQRLGQALYNHFYGSLFDKPNPQLFYETDPDKAMNYFLNTIKEKVFDNV